MMLCHIFVQGGSVTLPLYLFVLRLHLVDLPGYSCFCAQGSFSLIFRRPCLVLRISIGTNCMCGKHLPPVLSFWPPYSVCIPFRPPFDTLRVTHYSSIRFSGNYRISSFQNTGWFSIWILWRGALGTTPGGGIQGLFWRCAQVQCLVLEIQSEWPHARQCLLPELSRLFSRHSCLQVPFTVSVQLLVRLRWGPGSDQPR